MNIIEKEFEKMITDYPIGMKIIFENLKLDKFNLNTVFYIKNGEYTIKKHGFLNIGNLRYIILYFDKDTFLQICFEDDIIQGYWLFSTFDRYYLRNSFDRLYWLGGKDERGFLFYDDYFYVRELNKVFREFLEKFCADYFTEFDDFDSLEYEIADAYCKTNLAEILTSKGINKALMEKYLDEEIENRDWIIDYSYDGESLELYYHLKDGDLEKRFNFIRNSTYKLSISANGTVYDKKIISSIFQRDVEKEFYEKEYIGMNYDTDLSTIDINVGIPIDISDFKRGE